MSVSNFTFQLREETPADQATISNLVEKVFGPGMYARAAFALREGRVAQPGLSFIAQSGEDIIGTVRQTQVLWGDRPVLMLGPLAVDATYKSKGIGRALMNRSVEAAQEQAQSDGAPVIVLVGDYDYYAPFGFAKIAPGLISLPRPTDPQRILACELVDKGLAGYSGALT